MRTHTHPLRHRFSVSALALVSAALLVLIILISAPSPVFTMMMRDQPDQVAQLTEISSPTSIMPGAIGDFRFKLTNNSGDNRTFTLTTTTIGGVSIVFPSSTQVTVADGATAEFSVSALVPAGALPGSTLTQILYANSSTPTSLQLSNFFMVHVGSPTPIPTLTPHTVLNLPLVRRGDVNDPQATPTTLPPTAIVPVSSAKLKISDVFCRDPAYPEDSEYIELRNDGTTTVNLLGWKIVNATRSNLSYTFPNYTVEAGPSVYLTLYSRVGNNQPDFAEFYWNRTDQLWNIGDRAELRDAGGNLIDAYVVPADSCNL